MSEPATMMAPVANFYESRNYQPLRDRRIYKELPPSVEFSPRAPKLHAEMAGYFDEITFERVGTLHGEYALLANAEALITRSGKSFKVNVGCEDRWADRTLDQMLRSDAGFTARDQLLAHWDQLLLIENPAILSDANFKNYFHASLEMVPRLRYFDDHGQNVLIPKSYLSRYYMLGLLGRAAATRTLLPQAYAVRVRDPLLAHDRMSDEGVHWLRNATGFRFAPGDRRIYVRRGGEARQGGISEGIGFLQFLQDYKFEIVNFGGGDRGVEEQLRDLNGASIILAAHGANLTNIVYATSPISVIEVFGIRSARAMYAHIAAILKLRYYGLFSIEYDPNHNIVVDCDELRYAMTRVGF